MKNHSIKDLQNIFNKTFQKKNRTVLLYGADEPFYEASKCADTNHKIICRSDYFSSALHEISHWCIAGRKRRELDDYGYWYNPDGRGLEQQKEFEDVEVRPQSIEWAFSLACHYEFVVSVDNLSLSEYDTSLFEKRVRSQLHYYFKNGLPSRAQLYFTELNMYYQQNKSLEHNFF